MIQAAKLASAKRITAVVPWFPYSRQDKKSAPREPITAKLVADVLEGAGADRVVTMDLHAGQIQGFFTVPVDHMTALQLFAQHFRDKGLSGDDVVAVSPDPGRAKMARRFGQMLEADLAIMNKVRPEHDTAEVTEVIGHVDGKVAIMSDDMIVTGGTLIAGAAALREAGAIEVYACATHGLFSGNAFEKIDASELQVTVTDTVPIDPINAAREHRRAPGLGPARGDDHEHLRRRLGLGDLRGREPALLETPLQTGRDDPVIEWLLEGDPAIRWQVMRDLLDEPVEVWERERWRASETGWGAELLAHQGADGEWPKGRWTASTWTLLLLIALGLPEDHPSTRAPVRRLLDRFMPPGEDVDGAFLLKGVDLCHLGFWLGLGAHFLDGDTRLGPLGEAVLNEVISERTHLTYPWHWHYTVLRGLDYFRLTPAIEDERAHDAIRLLRDRRKQNGRWPLQKRIPGTLLVEMEKPGGESRWNTLRALRVLRARDEPS